MCSSCNLPSLSCWQLCDPSYWDLSLMLCSHTPHPILKEILSSTLTIYLIQSFHTTSVATTLVEAFIVPCNLCNNLWTELLDSILAPVFFLYTAARAVCKKYKGPAVPLLLSTFSQLSRPHNGPQLCLTPGPLTCPLTTSSAGGSTCVPPLPATACCCPRPPPLSCLYSKILSQEAFL